MGLPREMVRVALELPLDNFPISPLNRSETLKASILLPVPSIETFVDSTPI